MLAAVFAVLFGLSLLPGRKPLCFVFAEKISSGIIPHGATSYCRRLTWVWFLALLTVTLANLAMSCLVDAKTTVTFSCIVGPVVVASIFAIEKIVRNRRFSVVFTTSGSTGGPKTIVKTFESLAKETAMHRDFYLGEWNGAEKPVFLSTVEKGHMYGTLWRVMLPEALGCETDEDVIMSPEVLIAKMKNVKSVFLVTTPSFLSRFTAYACEYDVPQNAVEIVTSGAMLQDAVSKSAAKVFGVEPRQIYGSTETGGIASRRGNGLWEPFKPVKLGIRDGRLLVKSPFSFRRLYLMGDGVEFSQDGIRFNLLGRKDRLVKINEERVNLAEMEEKMSRLGLGECALAVLNGTRGPYLGAVIAGVSRSALEMRHIMLPIFPKGTVPKRVRFVEALPRNAQGKVLNAEVLKCLAK